MPRLSDVEVSLMVDGVALPEYKVIPNGDLEVSCYVPSETGKVSHLFSVKLLERRAHSNHSFG